MDEFSRSCFPDGMWNKARSSRVCLPVRGCAESEETEEPPHQVALHLNQRSLLSSLLDASDFSLPSGFYTCREPRPLPLPSSPPLTQCHL